MKKYIGAESMRCDDEMQGDSKKINGAGACGLYLEKLQKIRCGPGMPW